MPVDDHCSECGATLPVAGRCTDLFHELLALEHRLLFDHPEWFADGETAHFLAVSSYAVQHPANAALTERSLAQVSDDLERVVRRGERLPAVRLRTRRETDGATRVRRRAGEPVPPPLSARWSRTVLHVLRGPSSAYEARVTEWARSVVTDLDRARGGRLAEP